SRNAQAYLGSPEVVAASAVAGFIDLPGSDDVPTVKATIKAPDKAVVTAGKVRILPGFPETITGEIIFCHQDNINTDGIYPGKYTYIDDFTPEQQAQVVMENYDPNFTKIVKSGDVLIGGFNFGTGSSREQAATSLKYRGIQLVVAGSFNETYKRNALNNGFLAIEAPELVTALKQKFGSGQLSVRTEITANIDFVKSVLVAEGVSYAISPVGTPAQELILVGGLENWVKKNLKK
ncbi:MAG TPA: hypothetical protein VMS71_05905, partial [Candidatus Acidoferrum sp.]|nr:hypothetical protein [Candidatus Acidoferrum sp.]